MFLRRLALLGVLLGLGFTAFSIRTVAEENSSGVTFNKDVLPILQENCQTCHRPGEIAPMSFLTYKDTRPYAKAIKAAVISRQMPPWFADPAYGHFANDRQLSDAKIKTLVAWADGGTLEGDPKDAPKPQVFHEGWNIQPDMIIEMPKDVPLPATGTQLQEHPGEGQLHRGHLGYCGGNAARKRCSRASHARDSAPSEVGLDEKRRPGHRV
jgi:hypothetical protein